MNINEEYNFLTKTYRLSDLEAIPEKGLTELRNLVAANLRMKRVGKARDHASAVARTWAILQKFSKEDPHNIDGPAKDEPAPKTRAKPKAPVAAPKQRKRRGMRFVFKPENFIRTCKPKTLRGDCVKLLLKGAAFSQVEDLVKSFDKGRDRKASETVERRAYELVRIMHYYLGYGIRQEDNGKIVIYT